MLATLPFWELWHCCPYSHPLPLLQIKFWSCLLLQPHPTLPTICMAASYLSKVQRHSCRVQAKNILLPNKVWTPYCGTKGLLFLGPCLFSLMLFPLLFVLLLLSFPANARTTDLRLCQAGSLHSCLHIHVALTVSLIYSRSQSPMEYYSATKKNKIMPFTVTWMDLEIVILSEVGERQLPYDIAYMWSSKNDTNNLSIKQKDSQMQKTNYGYQGEMRGRGINWEIRIDIYTPLNIK